MLTLGVKGLQECIPFLNTWKAVSPPSPPLYLFTPVDSVLSTFGFLSCPIYIPLNSLTYSSQQLCCGYKTMGFQIHRDFLLHRGKPENILWSGLPGLLSNLCSKPCFPWDQSHGLPPSLTASLSHLSSLTLVHSELSQSAPSSLQEPGPRHRSPWISQASASQTNACLSAEGTDMILGSWTCLFSRLPAKSLVPPGYRWVLLPSLIERSKTFWGAIKLR